MAFKAVLQNIEGTPNGGVWVTISIINLATNVEVSRTGYSAPTYDATQAEQIGAEQCAYAEAAAAAAAPYQTILDSIKAGTEVLLATSGA